MTIVNSKTGVYAILGDPIAHSMSPVIMNSSFSRFNMDKVFLGLRCNIEEIDNVMKALKTIDLKGYVFTMPLKECVGKHLDELKDEAAITGAVNCVNNVNGYLTGYNTDSIGFWTSIQEKNILKKELKKLFVFGMGGFSKAAVTQAALQGVKEIVVTNHFEEEKFVNSFKEFLQRLYQKVSDIKVSLLPWDRELWKEELKTSDIVANATPNGLGSKGDLHLQVPYESVNQDAIFFDAIYDPLKTRFLEIAEERGHSIVAGLDLLSHQGACSFEIWTGETVDPGIMKSDALRFLQENH